MGKDIGNVNNECKVCLEYNKSKVDKTAMAIPGDLTLLATGEQISVDFLEFIKDGASGYLEAIKTKDKRTESAMNAIHTFIYTFGLPHSIKTDKLVKRLSN